MSKDFEENIEFKDASIKAAEVSALEVTDSELRKINKYALSPLTADDVFVFKATIGTNEIEDDRNYEPFDLSALKDLQKLYIGRTVIKDHLRKTDNQIARVYDTELIQSDKHTSAGEPHTELVAKCYMAKTAENAGLIAEIKAGIKKEVSTACIAKKAICSICGTDNKQGYCMHMHGRKYDAAGGKRTCYFTLSGAKEAFELSFVPVPAQKYAGTKKEQAEREMQRKQQRLKLASARNKNFIFEEDAKSEQENERALC